MTETDMTVTDYGISLLLMWGISVVVIVYSIMEYIISPIALLFSLVTLIPALLLLIYGKIKKIEAKAFSSKKEDKD